MNMGTGKPEGAVSKVDDLFDQLVQESMDFKRRGAKKAGKTAAKKKGKSYVDHLQAIIDKRKKDFQEMRERQEVEGRILFTGHMSYGPNVDAARWFAHEVFPIIRKARGNATFRIAGKQPHPEVQALAMIDGVEVTGYVDDMSEELTRAQVYVAPLRFGGGLKIKLLEAGGQACPVVATTSAMRGFKLEAGRDLLVADDPVSMAEATLQLRGDAQQRKDLGGRLRQQLISEYSPEAVGEQVARVFREMVAIGKR